MQETLPLFPLNTVLFPEGILPLRIFEPRYLSMVSTCMRNHTPFGVVLIKESNEAGGAAKFHETGTLAEIIDFDQLEDGMLGLTCRGQNIFRVLSSSVSEDQLVTGIVESDLENLPAKTNSLYEPMIGFLQELLNRTELTDYRKLLNENWDDLDWVSFRLSELLPLSSSSRQELLEMQPAHRLSSLHEVMQDHQFI